MDEGNSGGTVAIIQPHGGVLRPFQPGQSGNLQGRPLGRRSLSTVIKDLLESDLDFSKLNTKEAAKLAETYKGKSAWEAIVLTATVQALSGNLKAADFLARYGYGTKVIVETDPEPASPELLEAIAEDEAIYAAGLKALEREAANGQ